MKIEEAISILKTHNEWRRGADIPMTDVTLLGEAIDTVIKAAEKWEKFYESDMAFKEIRKAGIDLKTDIGLAIKEALQNQHKKDIDTACEWWKDELEAMCYDGNIDIEIGCFRKAMEDTCKRTYNKPTKDLQKESPTCDAEYLQSKIDAHTKRMKERGLTSDKMLEECRVGDSLTWHKVAGGDLPEDGQLVLISNPAIQFAIYKKVFHPVMRFGRKFEIDDSRLFAGVEYWMNIPEIPMKHETR